MSQPLSLNPFENSIQNIQNFIKFHQANAHLGLALLTRNHTQVPNPFLQKRSNLILNMDSRGIPQIMKTPFPQNLFQAKLNQAQLPFPFANYYDHMRMKIETPMKSEIKVEDSHHSDVTKDSESVRKEEEELEKPIMERKVSSPKILIESKKIVKAPKASKAPKKKSSSKSKKATEEEEEEENLSDSQEPKWRRKCWNQAEDKQLLDLIEIHGKKWSKIANTMGGRTGKQVRDRYLNVLIPDIKRTNWTDIEDRLILALYFQLGTKWCKIAEHLPGRTEGQVKNRFYTFLKKKYEKDQEEEEIKVNLVIKPEMKDLLEEAPKMKRETAPIVKREEDMCKRIFTKMEE